MATSSSDDSYKAPRDFHLSSSIEDSASRLSVNGQKCILCNNCRKTFHCKQCIRLGDFVHSASHFSERFSDKQLRYIRFKSGRQIVENKCCDFLRQKKSLNDIKTDLKFTKERIKLLQLIVSDKREIIKRRFTELEHLKEHNTKLRIKLPKYGDRVEKLQQYLQDKNEDLEMQKKKIEKTYTVLKDCVKTNIKILLKYIFPITPIYPQLNRTEEDVSQDTVAALAEATRTSYVRGTWVFTDSSHSSELQYCIVAPCLPGTGNYMAYNDWGIFFLKSIKEGVAQNPAFRISAGLTFTAQLLHVLAYYLDVRMPFKMMYSDFCSNDMTYSQFSRRVARLNSNVLCLCVSQGVSSELIHPVQTLQNIMHLLNAEISDIGRVGPLEPQSWLTASAISQLVRDRTNGDESNSEDGDNLPPEWEAVPLVEVNDNITGLLSHSPPQQAMSTQQATSMAGGLVTSAAASIYSIWRGWTARN
ncbi:beclin 1-associated autophagy-related key regulator-like isoform X2 [Ctenocephalides felis]|uniref:beclin 1-associated autophagy-related key regulator-like isoform X2 n=1 Tax=Ctenocephalides felis TaxID=7515 RepID=UPI000E6E261F|nr:beclin 1-associated autophagy-related key regulator-like isoform X2 [Ctenocephalides felis]